MFTSEERPEYASALAVRGDRGALQPFDRDKLFLSLYGSLQHRPTARRDAAAVTDTVMHKLLSHVKDGVINRRTILQVCEVALNRFDTAASVHYTAFHK